MFKDDAYRYLSDLILKGFLLLRWEFSGHQIIFKTINDKERALIKVRSGSEEAHDYNIAYMIASIFAIDHENMLGKKEQYYTEFVNLFSGIPVKLHTKIVGELDALQFSSMEALDFFEGFAYTTYSRRAWSFIQNRPPNRVEFTGIEGTDKIGVNRFQENWIEINQMLDEEERHEKDFALAILIASASNSRGARLTRARHDAEMQKHREKRLKTAREGLGRKKINWSEQGWAAPVDTAEELVAELERQMAGLKDRHDHYIENYMRQLAEDAENRKKAEQQRIEEWRRKNAGMLPISGSQRALTPKEAADLMDKKKSNNLVIVGAEDVASDEEKSRYLNKIGSKILTPRSQ